MGRASAVWAVLCAAVLLGCSQQTTGSGTAGTTSADRTGSPPASSSGTTAAIGGTVRYLALGDSVTSGEGVQPEETYPARLAEQWRGTGCTVELSNVAVSGYKASDVVAEQLAAVATFQPTIATVIVGGNDIANGVGVDEYRTNVRTIMTTLQAAGTRTVAVSQQFRDRTPVGTGYGTPEELAAKRAEFNSVLIAEVQAVGGEYVDLGALFEQQAAKEMWLADELHPTAEAYREWAAELFAEVASPCGK